FQKRRGRVAKANPRGEPAKQGHAVFAEAGPAPSSSESRALVSPGGSISISRAKRTAGTPKGRPAKRSAAGNSLSLSNLNVVKGWLGCVILTYFVRKMQGVYKLL
ncbi:hypothetical protein JG687_00011945, partial [Phytophthora cactorum]